jgi:hypothetical protein
MLIVLIVLSIVVAQGVLAPVITPGLWPVLAAREWQVLGGRAPIGWDLDRPARTLTRMLARLLVTGAPPQDSTWRNCQASATAWGLRSHGRKCLDIHYKCHTIFTTYVIRLAPARRPRMPIRTKITSRRCGGHWDRRYDILYHLQHS